MDRRTAPHATLSLVLLVAINLFNYIDRQVLAAVEPEIRDELKRELDQLESNPFRGATDAQKEPNEGEDMKFWMGLLSSAFLITYMVTAPVFGWFANRISRWTIIGIGVIIWSLASGASGWNWHLGPIAAYWALFATRCLVGVGEGAYGPVAPAMIADLYPIERRGRVMVYFYLAIPVGGALGYAFGEVVQGWLGWRWAFFLVVPPGIVLGLLCFFMRDPPRRVESAESTTIRDELRKYRSLGSIPSYVFNTLGMTAMTFAIGGLAFWMPDFLDKREVAAAAAGEMGPGMFGIGPRTIFGAITALSGLFATFAGGWFGERFRGRLRGAYFQVSAFAMFLGFPMILGFVFAPFPFAWLFVFGAVFCLFFNTGPTNTILANVTSSATRASGFALNILIIHLFGDVFSPPLMGIVSDRHGDEVAFFMVAFVVLIGGVFWMWGSMYLDRDTARAEAAALQSSPGVR